MKNCSQCNQLLPLESFDKQAAGYLGHRADCKDCRKRFTRTKYGLIKEIYAFQKAKSKRRGYTLPSYTETDLYAWADNQPLFHQLYDAWASADYSTNLKPSVDRKDDYISYTLDNIQLMTWAQNSAKSYQSQINGDNNKKSDAVDMLDTSGNFIQRFHSINAAARHVSGVASNIVGVIQQRPSRKKRSDGAYRVWIPETAYGYKWRYSSIPNNNSEKI